MASHDSIGILSVSLWSATENAPTVVIVDQKFILIATARVSTRSCKPVLFTAVLSSERRGCVQTRFCTSRPHNTHVLPVPNLLGACFLLASCTLPAVQCSPLQNRSTSHRTDPRTSLDRPTFPPSSYHQRNLHCGLTPRASLTGYHQLQACSLQDPLR